MKPLTLVRRNQGLRGSDRHRSGDLTIFSRSLYQLSYRAVVTFATSEKSPSIEGLKLSDPDGT